MNILVTGGAGFIGSFLTDELVRQGHKVTIYDNLEEQVHHGTVPTYINPEAQFIKADICDANTLDKALKNIDIVFHEAAMVGVGQSMYQIEKYTKVNTYGTAVLLDLIVNKHKDHIQKMIVAASMSEYGEGLYACKKCGNMKPDLRDEADLEKHDWELKCPTCGGLLMPKPTPESVELQCNSIYALNKKDQEDMFVMTGKAFGIPAVALRYFNTYGPRQSLSNPYTGVAAIFMSRIKAGNNPVIYEDSKQSRDFVSVHDIVEANIEVMKNPKADYNVYNVGSGNPITIGDLGNLIIDIFGGKQKLDISNKFRKGDIRHCFADINKISTELGWKPKTDMRKGLKELIAWAEKEESKDTFEDAQKILQAKGIV
jgi:dTDP-L-rhamnose 4-epimerase